MWRVCPCMDIYTIVTKCHLVSDILIIFGNIQFIVSYILLVLTLIVIHIGCYPFQPLLAVHIAQLHQCVCVWSSWPSFAVFSKNIITLCWVYVVNWPVHVTNHIRA
jgi:hypothetical protein